MVYLKSVENVIILGKLIGLLFLFCLPLLSIFFKEERPRSPCNGNHFSSYVYMCVCRGPKSVGGITWAKRAHAQSQY